jgi:glycerophosphoryl diester phosphodiesterase
MKLQQIQWIAHRGASYDAPENTLAAVQLAWEQGADAVEFDCRISSDGRIVLIHDEDTARTAGENLLVADATFSELQKLDVGRWKGSMWTGERIEPIETIFDTLPSGKRLFIEVKCGPEINELLVEAIQQSGHSPDAFAVISYDLAVVEGVKQLLPEVATCLVARFEHDVVCDRWSPTVEELMATANSARLDGLDIQARSYVDEAFVRKVRDAGLDTYTWTVDDIAEAQRLIAAGVCGIATNRPAWLRQQVDENSRDY